MAAKKRARKEPALRQTGLGGKLVVGDGGRGGVAVVASAAAAAVVVVVVRRASGSAAPSKLVGAIFAVGFFFGPR